MGKHESQKLKETKMHTMTQEEISAEIDLIGKSTQVRLKDMEEKWQAGLPFNLLFNKYGATAKKLGLNTTLLVEELVKRNYITKVTAPSSKLFFFSADSKLTEQQQLDWASDKITEQEEEKHLRKLKA